jgi:hypothetical protein
MTSRKIVCSLNSRGKLMELATIRRRTNIRALGLHSQEACLRQPGKAQERHADLKHVCAQQTQTWASTSMRARVASSVTHFAATRSRKSCNMK